MHILIPKPGNIQRELIKAGSGIVAVDQPDGRPFATKETCMGQKTWPIAGAASEIRDIRNKLRLSD